MTDQIRQIAREEAKTVVQNEGAIITAEVVNGALKHVSIAAAPASETTPGGNIQEAINIAAKQAHYRARNRAIFVPSYFYADHWLRNQPEGSKWQALAEAADVIPFVIINPASGPGEGPGSDSHTNFANQLKINRDEYGQKAMGYIRTKYGEEPLDSVIAQARNYHDWFGVEDFFLDEAAHGKDEQATKIAYYTELRARLKKLFPAGLVVANPGTLTAEGMLAAADYLMTFEREAAFYEASTWLQENYYAGQPRQKFWHCIHDVTSFDQAVKILRKAEKLNVGNLYLTNDTIGERGANETNPYDTIPAAWLWNLQIAWAKGELNAYLENLKILETQYTALKALNAPQEQLTALAASIAVIKGE